MKDPPDIRGLLHEDRGLQRAKPRGKLMDYHNRRSRPTALKAKGNAAGISTRS